MLQVATLRCLVLALQLHGVEHLSVFHRASRHAHFNLVFNAFVLEAGQANARLDAIVSTGCHLASRIRRHIDLRVVTDIGPNFCLRADRRTLIATRPIFGNDRAILAISIVEGGENS